jgi:hypothetical protein
MLKKLRIRYIGSATGVGGVKRLCAVARRECPPSVGDKDNSNALSFIFIPLFLLVFYASAHSRLSVPRISLENRPPVVTGQITAQPTETRKCWKRMSFGLLHYKMR